MMGRLDPDFDWTDELVRVDRGRVIIVCVGEKRGERSRVRVTRMILVDLEHSTITDLGNREAVIRLRNALGDAQDKASVL